MNRDAQQLQQILETHDRVIVGVDFDNTVFPLDEKEDTEIRCNRVIKILHELREMKVITICLYSIGSAQELKYKSHIMKLYGIPPKYVNTSPVVLHKDCSKPYFNILLDDKAGLNETITILEELKKLLT